MKTIKGPALLVAQIAGDAAPFDSWPAVTRRAADCGCLGVQVPSSDARLFDLDSASDSKGYCDAFKRIERQAGVAATGLPTRLEGQLVAVHPACDAAFDGFAGADEAMNRKLSGLGEKP